MSEEHRLKLEDQLCFGLYAATNAVTRAYRPMLRELGLTYPQYLVMIALWQYGESTVSTLASRLDLPAHAVTPMLERLERADLVVRRRSAADGRVVLVNLTPAGTDLEGPASRVQSIVECGTQLDAESLGALRRQLHELTETLEGTLV